MNKATKALIVFLIVVAAIELFIIVIDIVNQLNINIFNFDYIDEYVEPVNFNNYEYTMSKSDKIEGELQVVTKSNYNYKDFHVIYTSSEESEKCGRELFPQELKCDNALFFNYNKKINGSAGEKYRSEVYLECIYDIDAFNYEIDRISNINCKWSSEFKNSIYVEDLFNLPAYVLSYNDNSFFCYALLDYTNNKIIYIAFHDIKTIDNIVFDNYYAPYKDINDSSFPKELIHPTLKFYNMYAWYGR